MNPTSTSRTQNNSSFFTTSQELFKKFYGSPNTGMRKRERNILEGGWRGERKSSVSLHIEAMFSISGSEGLSERAIQSAGRRKSRRWDERARTHARAHTSSTSINSHLYLYLFFRCIPPSLSRFYASAVTRSAVLYPLTTPYFPTVCFFFFEINVIETLRLTRVA